ncbi:phage terminase large subunit family protein [Enterobacter asburiae]|uniref:phage terminase large subunit family protein n=1 Tax=Enterobacter asburiae TaxID=61645 RepID=UPI00192B6149|nr:phage terminase large subunit family protein [Enterobacter asburiae]MBL5924720.1 phage terminase large subunit family protein [Enterobacter asburiae]MBL5955507.1 phage terminase large subunit family protein [Enterobacter asburiae]
MILTGQGVNNLRRILQISLSVLHKPVPLTPVEWANEHYYLPKESSYQEGKWVTLAFQVAIMNAMGAEGIRAVNFIKSARVGYTKMLLAVVAYLIEHKKRNCLIFQPTEPDAAKFMKTHVEPTIREVPGLLALAPWYGKKHRDSTLDLKRFSNGSGLWVVGGAAAKNYREKSVDAVIYDELSSFEPDVEKEGSPTILGDKRVEGSLWPKSIRGSTPKIKDVCQIEKATRESEHMLRFHVPCPHCGEEQYLKFGDSDTPYGLKWTEGLPGSVFYLCEHNGCVIRQPELDQLSGRWVCEHTGIWTRDGLSWFGRDDGVIPSPRTISFHIWTAYSPFTTWEQIVWDYLAALKDPNGLKSFVNTTLGETYDEAVGEKLDHDILLEKISTYPAPVPRRVVYLTAGIDSQRNRYEIYVWGWAPGEEAFLIDKAIIMGRPDDEETLSRVDTFINNRWLHEDGSEMTISRICWDTGGIDPAIVHKRARKHGIFRVLPVKGASSYGKTVISMPRTRNEHGTYLCEIGTDTAKEILYARMGAKVTPFAESAPFAVHFPADLDIFSETEARQLVAEELVEKFERGKVRRLWDNKKRRNEALDCFVYAYAALRLSMQRWQLDLDALAASRTDKKEETDMSALYAALGGG